jgi:hypothetical protein
VEKKQTEKIGGKIVGIKSDEKWGQRRNEGQILFWPILLFKYKELVQK